MKEAFEKFNQRYEEERVPWDNELPPPEVIDAAAALPAGRFLDLGCGYGRASIYLAQQGWDVDGVDYVPKAIATARQRAAAADVAPRFHIGSVTDLDFLAGPFEFVLDVGCMHSLSADERLAYAGQLKRLVKPGGLYLLFVHMGDADDAHPDSLPKPLRGEIELLFVDQFRLHDVKLGTTQVEDKPPWPSGWFWWIRRPD